MLILAIPFTGSLAAQTADLRCLKEPYDWGGPPRFETRSPVAPPLEGAEVLSDSLRIAFRKARPEFITVFFERHQVIRFDTRDAIRHHATLTLPESFDPAYDQQDLPLPERDDHPRPLYFNATVEHVAARVTGPTDRARDLAPEGMVVRQRVKWGIKFHEAWSYAIALPGVMPGDTVEVHYKYKVPFEENWQQFSAARIFFEGPLRKHLCHVRVEAHVDQGFTRWGVPPDSTAENGGMRRSFWTRHDLPATANEVNARPHEDLQELVIGTQRDAGLYSHVTRSGMVVDIPYWVAAMRLRERRAHFWRQVAQKNFPDAQTNRMKEFLARHDDPSPVHQAASVHAAIARDFRFHWDDAWYDNDDTGLQRMGDQMRDGHLREISRYDLYSKYLSMLGLKYYTAYVTDKRVGTVTLDWLSPVWDNEWLFVLNDEGHPLSLYPKRRRFGLLPNELPFYWEGTQALVGDIDGLWRDEVMAGEDAVDPEFIPLPQLSPELNRRTTTVEVKVDLGTATATIEARILLSGQYSTMCRGAWLYNETDSTVDPLYGWTLDDATGLGKVETVFGSVHQHPPFRLPIELRASLEKRITHISDSSWSVDLNGLFTHVVPHDLRAEGRDLDFWFDFLGSDAYTYTLRFDGPVELLDPSLATIDEAFASHMGGARQIDPMTIEVVSDFQVKQERVPVSEAGALERLLDQAGRNDLHLTVRRTAAAP